MKEKKEKIIGALVAIGMMAVFAAVTALVYRYKLDSLGRVQVIQVAMNFFGMSLGIILFIVCVRKWDKADRLGTRFLILEAVVYFNIAADAADWVAMGHPEIRGLSIFLETLLYISAPLISVTFINYVLEYLGVREEKASKIVLRVIHIGFLVSLTIRIVNLFYPLYFYYDMAGGYHRGDYYPISNVFGYACGVVTFIMMIVHRKRLKPHQFLILTGFILAPVLAVTVNILFYGLTPAGCAMIAALTSLYVILNVEKSRERFAVETELSMATRIQTAMLPNLFPEVTDTKEYDLYASMNPAREVGGDFYDFFMLDENHLAFLVADVSDKGMGAALFMAVSKAMIKMRAQAGGSPGEVLLDVNDRLSKDNDLGMFVTVWLGYLDLTTGHVVACNGGHDYPALFLQKDPLGNPTGYIVKETDHGSAVGLLPGMDFPEIEFTMVPGDRIFLYTDGVNEAQGADGEQFDFKRLVSVLDTLRNESSESVCQSVKEAVDAFVGSDPQFDDMTMMSLTFRGCKRKEDVA